jgi:hypothetical protein
MHNNRRQLRCDLQTVIVVSGKPTVRERTSGDRITNSLGVEKIPSFRPFLHPRAVSTYVAVTAMTAYCRTRRSRA